ncbi:MAG: threonine/serine exporter family protein [Bacillota bacterium]
MEDTTKLLHFALYAGAVMLSSGAETTRVEDTMERIMSKSKASIVECISVNTFLIASIVHENETITLTRRIKNSSVNFEKICLVNNISRAFVSGKITLDEAEVQLEKAETIPEFAPWLRVLAYSVACGAFTLTYGGTFLDAFISFWFGTMLGGLLLISETKPVPYFFLHLAGGALAGVGCELLVNIVPVPDMIIIGMITPLLPGRIMTNSIRDMLEGNFICGATKLVEALLIGFAIAGGVNMGMIVGEALMGGGVL